MACLPYQSHPTLLFDLGRSPTNSLASSSHETTLILTIRWLRDDPPSCHHMFSQDSFAIVEGSSWHKWTPEEGKQEIAILVLEKLGSHYYPEDDEPKTDREALRYVHSSLASGRKLKLFVYSVNRYAMLSTTSASAVYYTKTLLHTISFVLLWRSARSTRRHTTGGW